MPPKIGTWKREREFKTIRNAVVQAALQLRIPREELPLPDPVPPCVDFVDDGSDVYPKAVKSLREPEVEPDPEVKQFLHEAAIRGSVDAVCGVGKQHQKTDILKAISMFELAAEQGNSYAEHQLGKGHVIQLVPHMTGTVIAQTVAIAVNAVIIQNIQIHPFQYHGILGLRCGIPKHGPNRILGAVIVTFSVAAVSAGQGIAVDIDRLAVFMLAIPK